MTPFIYPFQANYVRNELNKLLRVVYFVGDYRVYQATKDALESSIYQLFGPLTAERAALFAGITEIKGQQELREFMERLRPFIIPFPFVLNQVRRIFKQEKKLTIPDPADFDLRTMTYFGWRAQGNHQLYLLYPYLGELAGIRARYTTGNAASSVCCLCNQAVTGSEVGLVVAKTKSSTYKSIGNYMCLDSVSCNSRITSSQAIEEFFARTLAQ